MSGVDRASLDRRSFLGTTALVLGGLRLRSGGTGLGLPMGAPSPRPCSPESWRKGPVVLGRGDEPEDRWVQNFTCPAEPLSDGRWRLWYSRSGPGEPSNLAFAEGVPGGPMDRHVAVLDSGEPEDAPLAIGNLPQDWRPVQGVHLALPDGRHRLYFWARGPGVHRYLAADSVDGRRFRVLDPLHPCLYHPNDRAVGGTAAAETGLRRLAAKVARPEPGEPLALARLISNDATNVYRLPDGGFEMFSVGFLEVPRDDPRSIAHDNAPGWVRVIDRYTSEDGLRWDERRRVLVPDERDPIDQQFYYLAVTHTNRGRVGLLGHYRVQAQTMDLEWCFSNDGITWDRPARRPWVRRGAPGEPDSYGIYAPHALVEHAGEWWLFYTGVNTSHNGRDTHGEPASVVRLARCDTIWSGPS